MPGCRRVRRVCRRSLGGARGGPEPRAARGAEGAGARVHEVCAGMLARATDPGRLWSPGGGGPARPGRRRPGSSVSARARPTRATRYRWSARHRRTQTSPSARLPQSEVSGQSSAAAPSRPRHISGTATRPGRSATGRPGSRTRGCRPWRVSRLSEKAEPVSTSPPPRLIGRRPPPCRSPSGLEGPPKRTLWV